MPIFFDGKLNEKMQHNDRGDAVMELEYSSILEEGFRENSLFQTNISMLCCDTVLWMTEDKRVVTAIERTREAVQADAKNR